MSATNGYSKLFADIVTSTIWQEPNDCKVLWVTMLALKGRDHICTATVPALAKMCDITIEQCEHYLDKFQQPDKYSRSQEFEGRRLKRVDGGWFFLNGPKWQDKMSSAEKAEGNRERQERWRKRQQAPSPNGTGDHQASDLLKPAPAREPDPKPAPVSPSQRWPYERQEWGHQLVSALCKVGPDNWPAWKALVERHTMQRVLQAAASVDPRERWPDQTEAVLAKSGTQAPVSAATSHKTKVIK